jgi:hypothetical protein
MLMGQLDPSRQAQAIAALRQCRTLRDLEQLARAGWLAPELDGKRPKLIRHGSGTFLVVEYEDGWSTRLAMQAF